MSMLSTRAYRLDVAYTTLGRRILPHLFARNGASPRAVPSESPSSPCNEASACPGRVNISVSLAALTMPCSLIAQFQLIEGARKGRKQEVGARFALAEQSGAGSGFACIFLGCSPQTPTRARPVGIRYQAFGWHPHRQASCAAEPMPAFS